LADGCVVNANAEENTDLFWALKGGGANFGNPSLNHIAFPISQLPGIVTRFDLYTIPVHKIWYTLSIYPADQADACIDAFTEWQKASSPDPKATVAMIIRLDVVTVGLLYSAETSAPPPVFEPFNRLPPPLMVAVPPTNGTVHSLTQILAASADPTPMR
jgi:hypothetical protein